MARALIVGCGCRGQALGRALAADGWAVRGTTRRPERIEAIEAAGLEGVVADPDRVGTLFDHLTGVTVVVWALASAEGDADAVAALHGPRLERFTEILVDSPVRGFLYERTGSVAAEVLDGGVEIVQRAQATWRIPVGFVTAPPQPAEEWVSAARQAVLDVVASG